MIGRSLLLICGALLLLGGGGQAGAADSAVSGLGAGAGGRPEWPPLDRVENRLAVYGEKLAHWRELGERTASPALAPRRPVEWAGCSTAVENLVRGYGRLKEELTRRNEPAAGREAAAELEVWPVIFADIAFLEGECGQVYRQVSDLTAAEPRTIPPGLPNAEVQRPPLGEQEQLDKWNEAVDLFDSGNYDEAIGEFSGLANTPHAAAAKEKIREAQTLVATQLRRQAAGILARKTDDPAQRKKLLEESWTLLNRIVTNYPEAGIIDKVRQNQAQIEGQIDQLDPALLLRLKGGPDR